MDAIVCGLVAFTVPWVYLAFMASVRASTALFSEEKK